MTAGRTPMVHGDGLQSRDFTYVANAVQAVLKGEKKDLKELVLYHLREPAAEGDAPAVNAPMLVTFDAKGKRRYLLFLKRDADGRYASVTGQTDPAIGVKDLGSYP